MLSSDLASRTALQAVSVVLSSFCRVDTGALCARLYHSDLFQRARRRRGLVLLCLRAPLLVRIV